MSTPSIQTNNLVKKFGDVTALNGVSITIEANKIYGLLGRNGAGKTTLMQMLTGQDFPTKGSVSVFGENPVENSKVLQEICFIKESQRYPDNFKGKHVLQSAPNFYKNWDADYAAQLVDEFRLPVKRLVKKMSRGQQSALGVILGLASRAPITYFDEPYLGLDAVARHLFYDHLLEDFSEHPRTIILSTHLIDEVSNLLEHVIVIDQGEILIDQDAEQVRGTATTLTGKASDVEAFVAGRQFLHTQRLGGIASVTINARLTAEEKQQAAAQNLELTPVSLQDLIVHATSDK